MQRLVNQQPRKRQEGRTASAPAAYVNLQRAAAARAPNGQSSRCLLREREAQIAEHRKSICETGRQGAQEPKKSVRQKRFLLEISTGRPPRPLDLGTLGADAGASARRGCDATGTTKLDRARDSQSHARNCDRLDKCE